MITPQINTTIVNQQLSSLKTVCDQHFTSMLIINSQEEDFLIEYVNDAFMQEMHLTKNELIGHSLSSIYNTFTDTSITEQIDAKLKNNEPFESNVYIHCDDGKGFWCELTGHPVHIYNGKAMYYLLHAKNITANMHMMFLTELEREVYKHIEAEKEFQAILTMICTKIEKFFFHQFYCAIFLSNVKNNRQSLTIGSMPEKQIAKFQLPNTHKMYCNSDEGLLLHCSNQAICQQYDTHGCWSNPIYNQHLQLLGQFSLFFKTEQRLQEEELSFFRKITPLISLTHKYEESQYHLKKLAYYDTSLDIPNSHYFTRQLQQKIDEGQSGTVLIIQPSEYSKIVDFYSRRTGDELLIQIVERLQNASKDTTKIIGRLSTSTIIIAQETVADYESLVRQLTILPYFLKDREIYITFKIGITAFAPEIQVEESVRCADLALSEARKEKGTAYHFFERSRQEDLRLAIDVFSQLTKAIAEEQFMPFLQPKINLRTGEISSFEALARWVSPVLGFVPPSVFIPIAEDSGKIREVDQMILRKVLQWLRYRLDNALVIYPVSVNISPKHFYYPLFLEEFMEIVSYYKIDPAFIKLEVTESIELVDFQKAKKILESLEAHGFETSIDDFGVGFSSLSYLQQLPFKEIKIDRSFINTIDEANMSAVVQTIIQLSNNLSMSSVAEGIETAEHYETLKNMGCHTGQGYYFYKPMPLLDIDQLLEQRQNN